jgi:predicted nucleic acid-binding protein
MPDAVFIDANVVMYAVGPEHPSRAGCVAFLREVAVDPSRCHSSAEVLQELLHVYLRRGQPFDAARAISALAQALGERVATLSAADVIRASALDAPPGLQARDRIHLAVMERLGLTRIVSTDRAFDLAHGVTRLDPADFAAWKLDVFPGAT